MTNPPKDQLEYPGLDWIEHFLRMNLKAQWFSVDGGKPEEVNFDNVMKTLRTAISQRETEAYQRGQEDMKKQVVESVRQFRGYELPPTLKEGKE